MNSPACSSAAPGRALFGLHLNDVSSLKSKVVRNKMVTAGEAIEYKCLIRATNGKKTISTSVCISYILNLSFWFISVLLEPSCRVMQVSSTVECKLRLSCEE
ncbi:RNA-binding signal recognition particle subunit srp14, variant 2 [Stylosanthes scabra]|uniref:RNA-binding signal recognition particle subunit srp14, variant 2 n=1 Tax=Stylosanthes scabra TaxID=79078 RepID=A0ABU6V807_9FABA|nr:RNA-binding signal recognition particle subunit srp14, variant 2 [Stylosanthes scabra]